MPSACARACVMWPTISSTPTPLVTCANTVGPSPRIFFGVALHDGEVGADVRREIGLVDHEQIALRDAGAALARHLVAAGDVDHVDRVVDELAAVLRGEVVAAALDEQQLGLRSPPSAPRARAGSA